MRSALVAIAVVLLAAGCGGSNTASNAVGGGSGSTATTCETVDTPLAREPAILHPPRGQLDPKKTYTLTFDTSCGTFSVRLDQKLAPHTTASLVSLARKKYFDDTIILRIVPNLLIQGGDPTQTGAGQPGYGTVDVPPKGTRYTRGIVAMAKSQLDQPGTAGSQFFVVTAKRVKLPPIYAVVGRISNGLDVIEHIGKLGNKKQLPKRPILVKSVTVSVAPDASS
jgi:peptidyl-prolyl cis-trans isomerase B (cyclophilin B)